MIAVITIMDEKTGKIFVKDQTMQPTFAFENINDMTDTYRWDFKYSFFKDLTESCETELKYDLKRPESEKVWSASDQVVYAGQYALMSAT